MGVTSRRSVGHFAAFVTGALLLAIPAGTASAHIDPDPKEAQAGSEQSIGFTVEHGCDGSPTVQLDMRLPEGVGSVVPEPPDGWDGSLDDNVVTFTGGPLPDDVELAFNVRMVLPRTPDTTVYFPFVQRCEVGEIRWIDLPTDGGQLGEPAPALRLTGPVADPPPATDPPVTTPPATDAPVVTDPPATNPPDTTTVVTTAVVTTTVVEVDDDGGSSTPIVVAVIAVLVAAGGGAFIYLRRRT